jgi:hypothetical protein
VEFFLRVSLEGPWLHVPGEPVAFYVGFTTAQGEASNLSMKYVDRQKRWVRIRERFIFRMGGRGHVTPGFYRRLLAQRWHKTAVGYQQQRRFAMALACYRKALGYRPLRLWTLARLSLLQAGRFAAHWLGDRRSVRTATTTSGPAEPVAIPRIAA